MKSLTQQLADYLMARPNQWLGAREMEIGGRQSWRTRLSDLRKPPYNLTIENRVHIARNDRPLPGQPRHWKVSEYRLVVSAPALIDQPSRGANLNEFRLS